MARIIAGTHKGRRITAVPGTGTRPTSDRVKESLFSRLEGYDALEEAVVVDLFAGSGALGLEAVSRGARTLEAVDIAESAYRTLTRNAALFAPEPATGEGQHQQSIQVHKAQAARYLKSRHGEPIELLFLDPPYDLHEVELAKVLEAAAPQLHPAATVVVERDARSPEPQWPGGLRRFHEKSYGSTRIWLAEPQ